MSDHSVHAYNGCVGKSGQTLHSYNSDWMAHWTQRSYDALMQNHNCASSSFGNIQNCHATNEYYLTSGKEIVSNICKPAEGLGEIETGSFKFRNESMEMASTTMGTKKPGFQFFPMDGPCKNGESSSPIKDSQGTCNIEALRPQINHNLDSDILQLSLRRSYTSPLLTMSPDANKTPSGVCHSEPEGLLQNTKEPVETSTLFGDSSFAISRPLPKDLTRSATQTLQSGYDDGYDNGNDRRTSLPSPMGRPAVASREQLPNTNLSSLERKNLDYQRHSTFLVCEEKIESHSKSVRSLTSYLRHNKSSLFQTGPCTSNNHSPAFGGEQFQNMHDFTGVRLFQNQSTLSKATESEALQHGCNSLREFPHSLQDVESTRICTTVDSVVPLLGGHPRFSQTTHSFLITKEADLNSCKGKQTFRNSRESAEFNGSIFIDLHLLSPSFGHRHQGVKNQSLGGSTDSEGRENVEDVKTLARFSDAEDVKALGNYMNSKGKKVQVDSDLKNESSAETDIMNLDDLKEKNQLSSVNSALSNKVLKLGSTAPQLAICPTREVGRKQHDTELPDMNLELPALPGADNVNPSSSKTQSLDMETVLANAEELNYSKSDRCPNGSAEPEPSNRRIKRLKLNASGNFAFGTKSSNIWEVSCHEKKNLSSEKVRKGSVASSEPTVNKLHSKELMVSDKATPLVRYGESTSMDTAKQHNNSLTSQSWIRRWCHNPSVTLEKKPETVVVSEPQSSKLAFEDLHEKQFPSIAAMALMGKAMNGFQPCDIQKRGSFVVWNTRAF